MSSLNPYFGIVVGVDGSPASRVAVDWAARDAAMRHLPLTLVHAAPAWSTRWPASIWFDTLGEPPYEQARRIVADAVKVVDDRTKHGSPAKVITKVVFADPVTTLVDLSRDAELVVVGSHRRGVLRRRLFGSVSSELVRRSLCPVAVVHDEDPLMPHPAHAPVLVSDDGSAASERATMLAREEASRRGVTLIVSDAPAARIVEQSESAQLVVVGDQNHVGATVADGARMPVIVAH